ncbi:formin 2 [Micromonospora pattaloongensis]|uniref:Formin 2 n=1 Tax=Micromonospora pattaloongensis TaxID=405436 RepID=A0A1H3QPM0_9ACTN|nr:hypothetical protein [Micromonospora pattaloongensis]SDZ15011.1 formin 2 [Micromonospora pattaloongensis]
MTPPRTDDAYRVALLLRDLERVLHPLAVSDGGQFRAVPGVPGPLPPTTVAGAPPTPAARTAAEWAASPRPPSAGARSPAIRTPWVEPPPAPRNATPRATLEPPASQPEPAQTAYLGADRQPAARGGGREPPVVAHPPTPPAVTRAATPPQPRVVSAVAPAPPETSPLVHLAQPGPPPVLPAAPPGDVVTAPPDAVVRTGRVAPPASIAPDERPWPGPPVSARPSAPSRLDPAVPAAPPPGKGPPAPPPPRDVDPAPESDPGPPLPRTWPVPAVPIAADLAAARTTPGHTTVAGAAPPLPQAPPPPPEPAAPPADRVHPLPASASAATPVGKPAAADDVPRYTAGDEADEDWTPAPPQPPRPAPGPRRRGVSPVRARADRRFLDRSVWRSG